MPKSPLHEPCGHILPLDHCGNHPLFMNRRMFPFTRKLTRLGPPAVPSDKVIPVAYWDHHSRNAILNVMLRFDHRLDPTKLRGSLERLLDRQDGWRRLGARLRMDSNGRLNWHVPTKYTAQRPTITYHHERHDEISIAQHSLASRLRSRGDDVTRPVRSCSSLSTPSGIASDRRPWMVEPGSGVDFSPLMRRPEDPTRFEDYLCQDIPMIGLQIVTFNDATLVSLGCSHIMWDAMGRKDFLDAWSLTLQGREDEVIPLIEDDPLELLGHLHELRERELRLKVGKNTTLAYQSEQYKYAHKQLNILQLLTLGLRQALDKTIYKSSRQESRTICIPAAYIDSLRKDALKALQNDKSKMLNTLAMDKDDTRLIQLSTFLSDGDIICAWWTRHIIASRVRNATKSHKTIAILNMMGLRGILAQAGLLPKSCALIGNAMVPVPVFLRAQELVLGGPLSLGRVARALRLAIAQLGTRPQVEAFLALQRRSHGGFDDKFADTKTWRYNKGKSTLPALFGDAGMHMIICSNWTKAGFFNVDFSAAGIDEIVCGSHWEEGHVLEKNMSHPVAASFTGRVIAKPSGVHMHLITAETPDFLMSIFTVLGRDASDNYWIQGMLRKQYWPQIEKALAQQ